MDERGIENKMTIRLLAVLDPMSVMIRTTNKECWSHDIGVGEGGGGQLPPPTLGHECTLKFNEEKISSCSMSATAVAT